MKMIRIILVIIFVLCSISPAFPIVLEHNGVCYTTIDNTENVMVVRNPNGYTGRIVIPSFFISDNKLYKVTGIAQGAFNACIELTNVSIPKGVTSIGDYAFNGCSNLVSIEMPNSVTSIGDNAFFCCSSLTSLEIPNSVTSIGYYAFYGCENIQTVAIPVSLTNMSACVFDNTGWYNNLPDGEIYLGNWFYGYKGEGGSEVCIKSGTLGIAGEAFRNYSDLTSIDIPNSVVNIGDNAFSYCSKLTSVRIPNSVVNVGDRAFVGCSGLTSVEVEGGNKVYDSRGGSNAIIETATNTLIAGCKNTVIPNTVVSIGNNAFSGCTDLTSINIPNSVENIGDNAFSGCTDLTSINIPNSVVSIGDNAFYFCGLTNITIPKSVMGIGNSAFEECSELANISIPNSVTNIGDRAFVGCSRLASIEVESGNKVYDSRGDCNAIIETATNTLIAGCKNTIIPNGVVNIGDYAFYGCEGLTSIAIPNSVKSIGDYAFANCSNLTSIRIPKSVVNIGDGAFHDCTGLAIIEVESGNGVYDSRGGSNAIIETATNTLIKGCKNTIIPNGIVNIGDYAFYYCLGLTSINIPNSVVSIGDNAFYLCTQLRYIRVEKATPPIIGSGSFDFEHNKNDYLLYVPYGSKSTYAAAPGWESFTVIEEYIPTTVEINKDNGAINNLYYDLNGNIVNVPANGIYIKNGKKIWIK